MAIFLVDVRGWFWRQDLAVVIPQGGLDFATFLPQPPVMGLQVCTTRTFEEILAKLFLFFALLAHVQASHGTHLGVKVNFEESVLSSHHMGPGDHSLVTRLGSQCLTTEPSCHPVRTLAVYPQSNLCTHLAAFPSLHPFQNLEAYSFAS